MPVVAIEVYLRLASIARSRVCANLDLRVADVLSFRC